MKYYLRIISVAYWVTVSLSCSILKTGDSEKEIRVFLQEFQTGLVRSDDEILSQFNVKQSREAVLSVINILRNKDPFIVCDADIANARITIGSEMIKVEIPTTFRVEALQTNDTAAVTLVIWLAPKDKSYRITQVDGEEFYQAFTRINNSTQWEAAEKLAIAERSQIYDNARALEASYDSVIWYTTVGTNTYFYVVQGTWNNYFLDYNSIHLKNTGVSMGLVDAKGEVIIPLEYDLIGSIGFERSDLVEVTKDGKVGYFNIATKQLVTPMFDLIIPYDRENAFALVKNDSTYGWIDNRFNYSTGFVSERMKQWLTNFEFLRQSITLQPDRYNFCEIPAREHVGNGIIAPPSYLSKYGIFDEIEGGISTTSFPMNGWTEYIEISDSFLETVTDNLRAVVTTIRERYLEAREEFYTSSSLLFVNNTYDTLGAASISGEQVSMHPIDSTLIEVRTPQDYWFMEYDASEENNLYHHEYFAISPEGRITKLKCDRLFAQTQFVKLDSSYLTGEFTVYNDQNDERTFLSEKTITFMRDEILASYGYRFPTEERDNAFSHLRKPDEQRYTTLEEVEPQMSDIDKRNLAFLNAVLSRFPKPSPA